MTPSEAVYLAAELHRTIDGQAKAWIGLPPGIALASVRWHVDRIFGARAPSATRRRANRKGARRGF